jgi:hypothetical protein
MLLFQTIVCLAFSKLWTSLPIFPSLMWPQAQSDGMGPDRECVRKQSAPQAALANTTEAWS